VSYSLREYVTPGKGEMRLSLEKGTAALRAWEATEKEDRDGQGERESEGGRGRRESGSVRE
jgi:hypothetical protein